MSSSATVVSAIVVAYLLTHRADIAREAVYLRLKQHSFVGWLLGKVHNVVLNLSLVLGRLGLGAPQIGVYEQLARYQYDPEGADLETVVAVRKLISKVTDLTQTEVTANHDFEHLKRVVEAESFHDLGFQTEEPFRDFRGAGEFGLRMFELFCADEGATQIIIESGSTESLRRSQALEPWYPLALVSIRVSMQTSKLLAREPVLALLLNQLITDDEWQHVLGRLHVQLLTEFHAEWVRARKNGEVKQYFDTEKVLDKFDAEMPRAFFTFYQTTSGI